MTRLIRATGLTALMLLLLPGCTLFLRMALGIGGVAANAAVINSDLSDDGRYATFESGATNLVVGDTNGVVDVFLRDENLQTTTLVSHGMSGPSNGASWGARVSGNGQRVVFVSTATNLVPGDTNARADVFVWDRLGDTIERVSVNNTEEQLSWLSGASSCTNPNTSCLTSSRPTAVSADGNVVAFASSDPATLRAAVLVRNLDAGTTTARVVSEVSPSTRYPEVVLSGDGEVLGVTELQASPVPPSASLRLFEVSSSESTSVVAPGQDHSTNSTFQPDLNATGTIVAFRSTGTHVAEDDIVTGCPATPAQCVLDGDVFTFDTSTSTFERISNSATDSEVDSNSSTPSISGDGTRVAFTSSGSITTPSPPATAQGYIRHRPGGFVQLLSQNIFDEPLNGSTTVVISGDGTLVAMNTDATAFVHPSTQGKQDLFLRPALQPRVSAPPVTFAAGAASVPVTLVGEGFTPTTSVHSDSYDLTIDSVTYVGATQLDLVVSTHAGAVVGPRTLVLYDVVAGSFTASSCECIEAAWNYATPPTPPTQPTIIVINTDDQRWDGMADLPLIYDRTDWARFDNSFVHEPQCCPSRATMFTGQYGFTNDVTTLRDGEDLDESNTVATMLSAAGYETSLSGKYLNGYPFPGQGRGNYVPVGWDNFVAFHGPNPLVPVGPDGKPPGYPYNNIQNIENGMEVQYFGDPEDYSTDRYAAASREFMRSADPTKPWFIYYAPVAPHFPVFGADRHAGACDETTITPRPNVNQLGTGPIPNWLTSSIPQNLLGIEGEQRATCESLKSVDEAVDAFFRELEAAGRLDNAYVFFTSDNGYLFGEHQLTGKGNLYEESIRVPLYVSGPDVVPGAVSRLTSNIDLAPTLVDLAGATSPPSFFDGTSFADDLRGLDTIPNPDHVLLFGCRTTHGNADFCGGYAELMGQAWGIRTATHKYIHFAQSDQEQLFDLVSDPYELENVVDDPAYAGVLSDLRNRVALATAGTGTIRGTVTDSDTGLPVTGAEVTFFSASTGWEHIAQTDPNGQYAIVALPPSDYLVRFDHPSGSYHHEYFLNALTPDGAAPVTVAGGSMAVVDAQLQPTATAGATVLGNVTDESTSLGIAGIIVRFWLPGEGWIYETTTDANGSYSYVLPAPGEYKVRFDDQDGVYIREYWENSATLSGAASVVVAVGGTYDVDVALAPSGTVAGIVTDDITGLPLPGIQVRIWHPVHGWSALVATDSSGAYIAQISANVAHKIRFDHPTVLYQREFWDNAPTLTLGTEITVTPGGTVLANAALTPT